MYILSRSAFPFSEVIFNKLFYKTKVFRNHISKLKVYEVSSIIPSMAKSKFNDPNLTLQFANQLVKSYKNDINNVDPYFLKVIIERLMQIDDRC